MKENPEQLATTIADSINYLSFDAMPFCNSMSTQHRTLQQSFTRLCFAWIKFVASDNYETDARNFAAKEKCKEIVNSVEHLMLPMV